MGCTGGLCQGILGSLRGWKLGRCLGSSGHQGYERGCDHVCVCVWGGRLPLRAGPVRLLGACACEHACVQPCKGTHAPMRGHVQMHARICVHGPLDLQNSPLPPLDSGLEGLKDGIACPLNSSVSRVGTSSSTKTPGPSACLMP